MKTWPIRKNIRPAQTRIVSLVEAGTNVVIGYGAALAAQQMVFPLFGIETTMAEDSIIAALFTVVSLLRSYMLRRLFERLVGRSRGRHAYGADYRLAKQV